jgi:hypothetical protein
MDKLNGIAGNKIEPTIGEYRRSDLRQYYYQRSKWNSLLTFTVQRLKIFVECIGVFTDFHDPTEGHLLEKSSR